MKFGMVSNSEVWDGLSCHLGLADSTSVLNW